MGRPKVINDKKTHRVSFTVGDKQLKAIQRAAVRMGQQAGRPITVSEAIRAAVAEAFPLEQQGSLF